MSNYSCHFLTNYFYTVICFFLLWELRERLEIDDIISVLQQNRWLWYGHVLQKEDNDWVKKCTEYEVQGFRPSSRSKRTWRKVMEKDCQARKLKDEDATDCRWRKLIKDV